MENKPNKNLADFITGNSKWYEKAMWRKENEYWLNYSQKIAIKILGELRRKELTQKYLADELGVQPQQISKIVKGLENLTLETIGKIERALKITLITIEESAYDLKSVNVINQNNDFNLKSNHNIIDAFQTSSLIGHLVDNGEILTPALCGEENSYAMAA